MLAIMAMLSACGSLTKQTDTTSIRVQGHLQASATGWILQPCDPAQHTFQLSPNMRQREQYTISCEAADSPGCFADVLVQPATLTDQPGTLSGILRLEAESAGCATQELAGTLLHVQGNEPFWHIVVSRQGLLLSSPTQEPVALPHMTEQLPDGSLHLSSQANYQHLSLWLTPAICTDSMSGAYRHLSARLEWQGQTLSGCAYYAPDNPTQPPSTPF